MVRSVEPPLEAPRQDEQGRAGEASEKVGDFDGREGEHAPEPEEARVH